MDDLRGFEGQMREVHAYWTAIGRRCRAGMLLLLSFDVLLLLVWAGWVVDAQPEAAGRPADSGAAWLGAAVAAAAGLLRGGGGGSFCVALCWVGTGAAWQSEAYQWRVHTAAAFVRRANAVLRRFRLAYSEDAAALCRPDGSRALPPRPMPSASAGGGGGGGGGSGGGGPGGGGMDGGGGDDASCASAAASSSSWYAGAGGVDHSDGGGTSGAQSRRGGEGFGGVLLNALGGGGNIGHGRVGSGCAGGEPPGRAPERRLPPRMRSRTPMRRAPGASGRVQQKTIVD